jgi:hypothetical protein
MLASVKSISIQEAGFVPKRGRDKPGSSVSAADHWYLNASVGRS